MEKKTLKSILTSKKMSRIVGAYDVMTALIIQQAGFDAVWGSSFCVSASYCLPDANIVGSDTYISTYASMARAVEIPVIADCDTGYGNFHNVMHTVRELERNNVAGMCIEDKVFPKMNSLYPKYEHILDSVENYVEKIKAAADARKDEGFCIIARTEALIAGLDIDEVLYRAETYRCAGADAIIVHSRDNEVDKLLKVIQIWNDRLPLIVIPTSFPQISLKMLEEYKVYNVIFANQLMRAGLRAMKMYLQELRETDRLTDCSTPIASVSELFEIQNMDVYNQLDLYYRNLRLKMNSQQCCTESTISGG